MKCTKCLVAFSTFRTRPRASLLCLLAGLATAGVVIGAARPMSSLAAEADEAYYSVPLGDLKILDGRLPGREDNSGRSWRWSAVRSSAAPYAVLEGPGEVYGMGPDWWTTGVVNVPTAGASAEQAAQARLVVRAPKGREVVGWLLFPRLDAKKSAIVRFQIPAGAASDQRHAFFAVKEAHFAGLQSRGIPGAAWFRHEADAARAALGKIKTAEATPAPVAVDVRRSGELERTYELFSGGRALRENLQLDRAMRIGADRQDTVPLSAIRGVTIREFDWKPLTENLHPKLDAMASRVPADQHVVFFPSMRAAIALSDETRKHDLPLLRLAEPQSEDTGVIHRYQRQLGLPLSELSRLLGPLVVRSVAVTGSDPFFPTGTDVTVLFESSQPAMLEKLLLGRVALAARDVPQAKPIRGQTEGIAYQGFRSADRAMSSYVAKLSDAVVVTNSPQQLARIAAVAKGQTASIASLPEFTFFRDRYKLGDPEETALVFLSDATIRRWCGPQWRIADSRRTRAAAMLADVQAGLTEAIARNTVEAGPMHSTWPELGKLTVSAAGVQSDTWGTLDFLIPIAEMPLSEVTTAESTAYSQWRDGYERNWRWAFDPVGFRVSIGKNRLAGDLTVIPLIAATEYRQFLSVTQGGKFDADAGDRHGALLHAILAIDKKSSLFRSADSFLSASQGRSALSLGWVGPSIEAYVDDDPVWAELAKLDRDGLEKFLNKNDNAQRIPVAVRVTAENSFKLAAFLTTLRGFADQSAPDLTVWENRKHNDRTYVCVRARETSRSTLGLDRIFYTTAGGALTVSLNEATIHRAIDRALAAEKSREAAEKPAGVPQPGKPGQSGWLGANLGLQVDAKVLQLANLVLREEFRAAMQEAAWGNLTILNEWKRRFPDQDPVEVHRRVWGTTLQCPGGGKYVWNEKHRTLESSVYGHPGEPKDGPPAPPALSTFQRANFGITFEHDGLRARVVLEGDATRAADKAGK